MNVEEFEELRDEIERLKASHQQRKGEMNELLRQLQEEFGCHSIEEAEKLLADLECQVARLNQKLEAKTEKLKQEWEAFKSE